MFLHYCYEKKKKAFIKPSRNFYTKPTVNIFEAFLEDGILAASIEVGVENEAITESEEKDVNVDFDWD